MKTEQEQIEEIEKVLKDSVADYKQLKKKGACYCYAETLIAYGYGDVSEYKAEIERLKAENKRAATSYTEYVLGEDTRLSVLRDKVAKLEQRCKCLCEENVEQYKKLKHQERKSVKQAKIDVLNKLKKKYGFYSCYSWNCDVKSLNTIIDELIKEIQTQ